MESYQVVSNLSGGPDRLPENTEGSLHDVFEGLSDVEVLLAAAAVLLLVRLLHYKQNRDDRKLRLGKGTANS